MRNPQSNPQPPSSMELMNAKLRASFVRLATLARDLKPLHILSVTALAGALLLASMFLRPNPAKRSPANEPALSAAATSQASSQPAQTQVEPKQNAKRTGKKLVTKVVKSANKKTDSKAQSEPQKFPAPGARPEYELQLSPGAFHENKEAEGESEPENGDEIRARGNWFHDQRAYPFQHIPSGALQEAIRQRDAMKQRQRAQNQISPQAVITFPGDALWHLMGPQPVNELFSVNSGFPTASGRVTAIAVDPSDATGQTVYIGGAAGGVWKTTNGGTSWTVLTDTQPSLAIGSITIDPNNHNTIYVGTGEENFNGDAYYGAGILKSTDGGTTWTQMGASTFARVLGPQTGGALIGQIAVQPGNSNNVLAAVSFFVGGTVGGIYRSTDAGVTWAEDASPQGVAATQVVFESTIVAGNTAIAWAAMGNPFGEAANGIYRSTDSGATWTKQTGTGANVLPTTNLGRIILGYAPSTAGGTATVYAAIADSSTSSSSFLGFFKTVDGGANWTKLTSTPAFCNQQCFYDMAVGVNPANASFVVVGGGAFTNNSTSLFKTTDGGTTWTTSTAPNDFTLGTTSVRPHVDTHAFAFAANGATPRFYVGNDGGMWRTDNPTVTPPLWVDLNATLAITQFYPGPSAGIGDENFGFGGTQDNDTELFSGNLAWDNVFACGDGGFTAIDPNIPTSIYTTCDRGASSIIRKSVFNGSISTGQTFNPADSGIVRSDTAQFIPPLTIDQSNPNTLYFGTCRVYQTTDGANTWTPISGDLSAGNATPTTCPSPGTAGTITTMDVAHQNSSVVLAGTSNGKVWETTTGGISWNEIDAGLPQRHVTAVRTKRSDATGQIAYVTLSGFGACAGCGGTPGHVFKTTNGGTTWTNISGDLPDIPVNDLIVDHSGNPTFDALYIGTDVGVFSCPDPEAATPCTNWTVVGDGLPNSPVLGLAMRRSSRILRAATHGRSMWSIQLTDEAPPSIASLSSVTPGAVKVGAATLPVDIFGLNFSANTQVFFDGAPVGAATFVDTTHLTVTVNSSFFTDGHVFAVTLTDLQGADNSSLPFTVMNPILGTPTLTNPSTTAGVSYTLHFTGSNFVNSTAVVLTTFGNSQLLGGVASSNGTVFDVPVPSAFLTTAMPVAGTITNPLPGGGPTPPFNFNFTINPGTIIFNPSPILLSTFLGTTSFPATNVAVINTSASPVTITAQSITVPGTNPANFSFAAPTSGTTCNFPSSGQSGTGTITLAANGGTCNFGITYTAATPPGNATSTATLSVTDNASGSPQTAPIQGTPFPATVLLSPVNFGPVAVGTTSPTMNATLINATSSSINVTSAFTISGTNQADFHIVSFVANGDGNAVCPAAPFALGSFASCDVTLTFTPSLPAGSETAQLNVTATVPVTTINPNLTGIGIEITSISPSIVPTGGPAFTLTVNGGGFAPSAVVNLNGSTRLTTFVSPNQLQASIPASDIATAGNRAITVTTPVPGGTASEPKTLIVAQATVATNDNISFALNVSSTPARISQDTTQATIDTGGIADPLPPCGSGSKARSVWYAFTAPANGRVIADTRFSSYTTIGSVWTGTPGSLVAVAGACATGNIPGATPASLLGFNVTSGTKYFVMVTDARIGTSAVGGTLTASLDFAGVPPVNDDFNSSLVAAAPPSSNTVNSILATTDTGGRADPTPSCASGAGLAGSGKANSVWYDFVPTTNGTITADTLSSPYATILTAVTGVPGSFTERACNVSAGSGIAQSQVTFPATGGTVYSFMVSAFFGDGGTTNFHLTFTTGAAGVPATITATGGTPQSVAINAAFGAPLVATVLDSFSNPVSGANVTFTAPGSGASGKFSNNTATITIATNASGVASAPFTANATAGGPYTVTATVPGVATPANFSLTNNAGAAASMTANAGTTPQSAAINTAFANALAVTVKDAGSNPVSGVNVTFTAPGSGASGKFSNNTATITVATNASGVASAPFTANATAGGPYTVTAAATGLTTLNFSLTNTTGAAASMTANAGTTPQSATINTAFANALAVTVTDAGSNPISGVNVTFTAPGSGASGKFSNNTATITVATNASGVASAPFTANATVGGPYTVAAAATGLTTVNFSLTNNAGAAASMTANAGTTPQSTTINTAFANPLAVTVKDAGSNPVSGVNVTFTAPGSGASGKFSNNTVTITVATNASGIASAPFTANGTAGGPYTVTAAATGLTTVNFSLTNNAGAAASMTANAGTTPQSATINTAFANALAVTVTDAGSNPISGVNVTFTAPGSGASGKFSNNTATITVATNASGVASAPFTANGTAGGPYTVTAAATGLTTVNFSLTNNAGAAASMTSNAGTTPQSATINTAFANALAVTVKDAGSNPVSGVNVTFTAPGSGASGKFSNNTATITVATNASGVASAPFTANATAGGPYTVTAAATGLTTVNFSLTNTAGAAASMTANAGATPQSAAINTAFANALAVTVTDAGSNPVSGVNVTFTAPGSGASGKFSNNTATITVATNASGVASAPFTANGTAGGPYTVTAAATGLTTVNFSLTNTAGAAASMTANAGSTPQSATISTAFANPLAVTVKDAGSNPVAGVNVTFTAPGSGASGVFSNNTATIIVATNASGVASAPFTANPTAGGPYTVTAAATGVTTVNFSLTNLTGAAGSMTANAGTTPQSAAINTAFTNPLAVTVKDAGSNPVSGVNVTFTAPGSGASGVFSNNTATIIVATNASGVASAPFTANSTAGGPYSVTASATGLATVNFSLTNTAGAASSMTANAGTTPQSATINTAFANALAVTVKDAGSNPVPGVNVTFTAPGSGASGKFSNNTATIIVATNASGVASAPFTANATAGGPYTVTAAATGLTTVNFSLTNTAGAASSMTANAGTTPQSATVNTAFANALAVTVKDASSNPISGVNVTFTAPASGASGKFSNNTATITVATNASGVASAPFTANGTAGGPYTVTAAATGLTTVNFSLTNNAGVAVLMALNAGSTPQSTAVNTAFANPLAVTVTDAGSNPVSGVNVTFTAPGSGSSGKFSNNTATITVATNASGIASAPFTANGTAGGPYTVTAAATGLTTVNFSLTNLTGAAASMTANAGTTPQSAAVNIAFANALAVTVKDASSNPISGVNVTFTAPGSGASGVFSNNTATIIVATNASGVASAPFTANAAAGGPYTVTAAAAGVATVNFSLTNTAGTPTSMTANAGTTPQSAAINAAFANALAVTVKDASSNPVSGVNVTFTAPGSGASGKFSNNTVTINVATDASGVASAPFTANAAVGGPYTVTAAAAGLTTVNFSLTNTAGPAAKLAFSVQPTNVAAGSSIAPAVQVTVQDAGGNTVTTATNSITMAIGTNPSGGALSGTTSVAAVNGVATFANLSINKSGTGYTLAASATGLTGTTSSAFNVVAGAATKLVFAVQPLNVLTGAAITPAVQVTVQDALGNTVISAVNPVTMAIGTNPSAGTLSGTTTIAAVNGIAAFSTLSINKAGTGYTLTASAAGLTSATSAAFNVNNPVPTVTSLVPANANAGSGILLLTINGTNFAIGATVTFGSDPAALVPVTNTGTVITVNIPAADLATGGMFPVVVTNPGPGGGPSAVTANSTFIVNNPVPTVGNAAVAGKTHISGGAAFTLTVTGTNFVSNSVVNFNGSAVTTHFGTATQLTADIPASAVAKAGNVNVTVTNPAPAGGTSAPPFVFTVDGFTAAGPANTNVADGKVAMIEIDVTPTANGFTNAVTFNVTGLPKNTSFVFVPTSVTPNGAVGKTILQVTTKASSVVPPSSPFERPPSPLLRLLPLVWIAALLAGIYAMFLLRRTPQLQLRRYAAIVPLALLLLTGAVLAGCAGQFTGTPKGAAPLVVTATSGTMSQTANVTLTVQ